MAVLRVSARAAGEMAKSSGSIVMQDFFDAFLKLIAYADESGKIKNEVFAEIIRDTGDRLTMALNQPRGGITLLTNITNFISDPKDLLRKK